MLDKKYLLIEVTRANFLKKLNRVIIIVHSNSISWYNNEVRKFASLLKNK